MSVQGNSSIYTQPASQVVPVAESLGRRTNFVQSSEWKDRVSGGGPLVKMLEFESETPDSFFKEVKFLGYHTFGLLKFGCPEEGDGHIAIQVTFPTTVHLNSPQRKAYLKSFERVGLVCSEWDLGMGFLKVSDPEQKKKLVNFLLIWHTFPADQIEFMQSLTNTQDWRELEPNQDFLKSIGVTSKVTSVTRNVIFQA